MFRIWLLMCDDVCKYTLVAGWPTPLKNISQLGSLFPIYGKIIQMFQSPTRWLLMCDVCKYTHIQPDTSSYRWSPDASRRQAADREGPLLLVNLPRGTKLRHIQTNPTGQEKNMFKPACSSWLCFFFNKSVFTCMYNMYVYIYIYITVLLPN